MAVISSIFLVVALVLSVLIGAQTRAWTWGPAMIALGLSVATALPSLWRANRPTGNFVIMAFGLLVAAWFGWRASISPVVEFGQADIMLLASAIGAFVAVRGIEGNQLAEKILIWGIALLLGANAAVIGVQVIDPTFTPIFRTRASAFPSGFYSHYNEAANFLIAATLLVLAAALLGRQHLLIRILWGVVGATGLAAVYLTHSRGGILGAAAGTTILLLAALVIGYRHKAKWFVPAMLGVPVLCLGVGAYALFGFKEAQEVRLGGAGISSIMDNSSRLYFLGVALSCISTHPIAGGGSRSFSWESFRFFESKLQGDSITHKAEQVHNEIVQAATDYGLPGAGLLGILLFGIALVAVIRMLFSNPKEDNRQADVWRAGGLAAMAGMFVQSSFSFVFHLLPGIILLGICLGKMVRSPMGDEKPVPEKAAKILISLAAVAALFVILPMGFKASRVLSVLWSVYLGKVETAGAESKIDSLTAAIAIWPTGDFYQERAAVYQLLAAAENPQEKREFSELAINDYIRAEKLHPYDPGPSINRANILSRLQRDSQAEDAYERAIRLQGGMEPAFRSHYHFANHLMGKAVRLFTPEDPAPTLQMMETAAQEMEKSVKELHWVEADMNATRLAIYATLGAARETNGDYKGALEVYKSINNLPDGYQIQYRIGLLYRKIADNAWAARKPSEALGYFIEARRRIGMAPFLPQGITQDQKAKEVSHIEDKIAYLRGAKVEPIPIEIK